MSVRVPSCDFSIWPKIQQQSGDDIFIIALAEWVMFYKRATLSEFTPNKSAHFWGILEHIHSYTNKYFFHTNVKGIENWPGHHPKSDQSGVIEKC